MKKITLATFLIFSFCCATFAADAFLGWKCKDNTLLKAALAKDNKIVNANYKVSYSLILASNENPSNVNTLAKCTEIAKNAFIAAGIKNPTSMEVFKKVLQFFWCREDKQILNEINASPLALQCSYYKQYYIFDRKWVSVTPEEYQKIGFDILNASIDGDSFYDWIRLFEKYYYACLECDSNVVIKNLQTLYRKALLKLDKNEKVKPIVVKISLALKGYNVDVK